MLAAVENPRNRPRRQTSTPVVLLGRPGPSLVSAAAADSAAALAELRRPVS